MVEYIDRNLCEIAAEYDHYYNLVVPLGKIRKFPAADVAPVVHGHWEIVTGSDSSEYMVCSKCRKQQTLTGVFVYCPNCGARMDDGDE